MSVPTIAVEGLGFSYPDGTAALHSIDLHIHPGERAALLGPNGAGKTTLILHLNGIHMPQRGSVAVSGLELNQDNVMEIRRRVGIVFQDPDDQLFMPTVRADVEFGPRNLGMEGGELDDRVGAALEAMEVADLAERPPNHLSFGQKRRVAIAGVLAMEPAILVLDEPTSNLDPASRRELATTLQALDTTLLVVTHDLPFALEMCPRTVVMDHGRIVANDATPEILRNEALLKQHRLELPYGFAIAVGD
ncbi:MAG: ABC transporter ATP-binding protein [Acidimicrobiia bacterium]|nr:ABC transporter ATP-binding protein [Acidimicrobiia bacterium]